MSKKISLLVLAVVLILAMVIPSSMVYAAEGKKVLTAEAVQEDGIITVTGTVEDGMLAVAVQLCDKDGNTIKVVTGGVDNDNKYEVEIEAELGNYIIKVADYDGGTPKVVELKANFIEEINLKLTAPIIGEKVTAKEVDLGGMGGIEQDNPPVVKPTEDDPKYGIDETLWVKGTYDEVGDDFEEPISTTFEKDKYYYAMVYVTSKTGYLFSPDLVIKVNGEEPAEVFPIFGNGDESSTFFIAKIKATDKVEEANEQENATTPKTGDTIIMFIVAFTVALAGMVVTTIIRKNKKLNKNNK